MHLQNINAGELVISGIGELAFGHMTKLRKILF